MIAYSLLSVSFAAAFSAEPTAGQIGEIMTALKWEYGVPALTAAVVRDDSIKAAPVEGHIFQGSTELVRVGHRFHIGSCTKSMTAMLAAMLVEEGKLRWDLTVGEVLPSLKGQIHEEYLRVTLVQMLSHTAGIPEYTNFGQERLNRLLALPGTNAEQRLSFVADVLRESPVAPPGTKAVYSNAGYAVAGVIVEKAAGRPWEVLMVERIFRPLKMESAGFGWPATAARPDEPRGHRQGSNAEEWVPQPLDDSYQLPPCLWPAGAVHCSVDDFAKYAREHLTGLRGKGTLLKPETYKKIHSTWDGKPEGFTLGWGRKVDEKFGPIAYGAGSGGTFFARVWVAPEADLGIVVLTNCGSSEVTTAAVEKIWRAYQ